MVWRNNWKYCGLFLNNGPQASCLLVFSYLSKVILQLLCHKVESIFPLLESVLTLWLVLTNRMQWKWHYNFCLTSSVCTLWGCSCHKVRNTSPDNKKPCGERSLADSQHPGSRHVDEAILDPLAFRATI